MPFDVFDLKDAAIYNEDIKNYGRDNVAIPRYIKPEKVPYILLEESINS